MTIRWEDGKVILINQRKLPNQLEFIECDDPARIVQAINTLEIRGAPAIGVAAAMGLALTAYTSAASTRKGLYEELEHMAQALRSTRPTARNLFWAVNRVIDTARSLQGRVEAIKELVLKTALNIADEDIQTNKQMGIHGAALLDDGDTVGTICNAGWLATAGEYGTALGVIKVACEQGKRISVIALETRPVLQGARLTAFELQQDGIDVKVIADGAIGYCFSRNMIDKFICGADRVIVRNDCCVANKVGTHTVSIAANFYNVPFYVAAPLSTFDFEKRLEEVIIEERAQKEVTEINGIGIVPKGVQALNPAFDITPPELLDAIITEKGIIRYPFKKNLHNLLNQPGNAY